MVLEQMRVLVDRIAQQLVAVGWRFMLFWLFCVRDFNWRLRVPSDRGRGAVLALNLVLVAVLVALAAQVFVFQLRLVFITMLVGLRFILIAALLLFLLVELEDITNVEARSRLG